MARGRGAVSFDLAQAPTSVLNPTEWTYDTNGAPKTLVVWVAGKRDAWTLSAYPRRQLALEFAELFAKLVEAGLQFGSKDTYVRYKTEIGSFLKLLETKDERKNIQTISDINTAIISKFDGPLIGQAGYRRLNVLIVMLRAARQINADAVADDLKPAADGDRLAYISDFAKPKTTPRDSYSPHVVRQLRAAASSEMNAVLTRVRAGLAEFERLKAEIARNASRPVTPTELCLLQLANTGIADHELFAREAQKAGLRSIAPPDIDDKTMLEIAEFVAWGTRYDDIEEYYDLAPETVYRLVHGREGFIDLVEQKEDAWVNGYLWEMRDKIDERISQLAKLQLEYRDRDYPIDYVDTSNAASMFVSRLANLGQQLDRRISVLSNWVEHGIPRSSLGTVNLRFWAIIKWSAPELGIVPIVVSNSRKFLAERDCEPQFIKLEELVEVLSRQYPRLFAGSHLSNIIRKIEIIENCFDIDEYHCIKGINYSLDWFCQWSDKNIGISKTNKVRSTTTDKQYGNYIVSVQRLLLALRIRHRQLGIIRGRKPIGYKLTKQESPTASGSRICPTPEELVPFFLQLGLACQIDDTSMKNLKADCLTNAANGYVDINYVKNRAGYAGKVARETDGSRSSAGGIIRLVLEITALPRAALKSSDKPGAVSLWLAFYKEGFKACRFGTLKIDPWQAFCSRNEIFDDNGSRLETIHPSRFRKTVKAFKYQKANGDIYAIADDHSVSVARDHYADIPSLQPVHDRAIRMGLKHALDDTARFLIIDEADPNSAGRVADRFGHSVETAKSIITGEDDVWLVACAGFLTSPLGKVGEPCPDVFLGCLGCQNAVFVRRKLPNILRYYGFIVDRRRFMPRGEWEERYGRNFAIIRHEILPQFSEGDIAWANDVVAKDADGGAWFLPAWLLSAS